MARAPHSRRTHQRATVPRHRRRRQRPRNRMQVGRRSPNHRQGSRRPGVPTPAPRRQIRRLLRRHAHLGRPIMGSRQNRHQVQGREITRLPQQPSRRRPAAGTTIHQREGPLPMAGRHRQESRHRQLPRSRRKRAERAPRRTSAALERRPTSVTGYPRYARLLAIAEERHPRRGRAGARAGDAGRRRGRSTPPTPPRVTRPPAEARRTLRRRPATHRRRAITHLPALPRG